MSGDTKKDLFILLLSGSLDRMVAAVNTAASALALGRQVSIFMSWEPLLRLARGSLDEAPLPASLGDAAQGAREALAQMPPLSQMLSDLRRSGLKLYACSNTLQVLGISEAELEGKVDGISGATAFLAMSENAQNLTL